MVAKDLIRLEIVIITITQIVNH